MLITTVAPGALLNRYVAGAQTSIYTNPWSYTCISKPLLLHVSYQSFTRASTLPGLL